MGTQWEPNGNPVATQWEPSENSMGTQWEPSENPWPWNPQQRLAAQPALFIFRREHWKLVGPNCPECLCALYHHNWPQKIGLTCILIFLVSLPSPSDAAQNKGIVFLLDLRECSQDPKYLRNFISVLLNGYPLMLKMAFVVSAPMWVKPFLKTFRQPNKVCVACEGGSDVTKAL